MPSDYFYRTWCVKCQDWELHHHKYPDWNTWYCKECGIEHGEVLIKDVPGDKIKEQRERYKEWNANTANKYMTQMYLGMAVGVGGLGLANAFTEIESEVVECDAGQRKIDQRIKELNRRKREQERIERQKRREETAKYIGLGRNDICICGSGKKYKKCCLTKIQSYELHL